MEMCTECVRKETETTDQQIAMGRDKKFMIFPTPQQQTHTQFLRVKKIHFKEISSILLN
jgi:hypothetical protein